MARTLRAGLLLIVGTVALTTWLGAVAHAATGSVLADAVADEGNPTTNKGTAAILEVDASPRKRAFIRVQVTGVGGQQVTSARLRLRVTSQENANSDSGGRIHLQPNCDWGETTLTWSNQPPFNAAFPDSEGAVTQNQLVEFNVTSLVPGDGTYCFVIDTTSTNVAVYHSRQASSASNRPTFLVDTATGPTTTSTSSSSTTSTSSSTSSTSSSSTTSTSSSSTSSTSSSSSTSSTSTTSTSTSTSSTSTSSTSSTSTTSTSSTSTTTLGATFEILGAAGETAVPGSPYTAAESQELVKMFAGEATLKLTYDSSSLVADSGAFKYVAPPGGEPAMEITITNTEGTFVYSFSEYRLFLDDQPIIDTLVFTPFLPADTTVTLSTDTVVPVDIGLIFADPSATTLSNSSTPPSELDLSLLNIRGYTFIFMNADFSTNGFLKGAFRGPE
jgi:hypothetical protein